MPSNIFGALADYGAGAIGDLFKGRAQGLAQSLPYEQKRIERGWELQETAKEQADAQALMKIFANPDPQARAQAIMTFRPTSRKFMGQTPEMAAKAASEAERRAAYQAAGQPVMGREPYTTAAPGTTFQKAAGAATGAPQGPPMPPRTDFPPPSAFTAEATRSALRPPTDREFIAKLIRDPRAAGEADKLFGMLQQADVRAKGALDVAQERAAAAAREGALKREWEETKQGLEHQWKSKEAELNRKAAKERLDARIAVAARTADLIHEDRKRANDIRAQANEVRKMGIQNNVTGKFFQQERAALASYHAAIGRLQAELRPGGGLIDAFGKPVPGAEAKVKEIQKQIEEEIKYETDWAADIAGQRRGTGAMERGVEVAPGVHVRPK